MPPAGANVGANPPSLSNYQLSVLYAWQLSYFPYNFKNDTGQGAIFEQLYFRQAFQSLVDQEGVINGPLHGYGKPTVGPVASYPLTKYLSPQLAGRRRPVDAEHLAGRVAAAQSRLDGDGERDRHVLAAGHRDERVRRVDSRQAPR